MFLDLVLPLWLSLYAPPESAGEAAPAPAPAPAPAEEYEKPAHATRHDLEEVQPPHQFVFNADVGTSAIVFFPVPSLDLSAFFGTTLPKLRQRRASHWTAVGLRVIGSGGFILLGSSLDYFKGGLHTHLTITGAAGQRGRFAYSAGVGPVFGLGRSTTAHWRQPSPYGMEVEARFGYLFGNSPSSRVRGTFGGLFRFSAQLTRNFLPAPMLGLFLGMALVPRPVR